MNIYKDMLMKVWLCVFLTMLVSSIAHGNGDVGWIETIDGDAAEVQLLRNKKNLKAAPFVFLRNGDELSVLGNKTTCVITLTNGMQLRVDRAHPLRIQQNGEVPSLSWNLIRWVASLGKNKPKEQRVFTALSRAFGGGNDLSIPLLRNEASIIAGDRTIALAWKGGVGPYDVSLKKRENNAIAAEYFNVQENRIIKKITLAPGVYDVIIKDASGMVRSSNVAWNQGTIVAERDGIPEVPAELRQLPGSTQRVLTASWLASLENGRWILEAYMLLAELPQRNELEDLAMKALENGGIPSI